MTQNGRPIAGGTMIYCSPRAPVVIPPVLQRDVEQYLKGLTERRLPAGDSLAIEVPDIDLAGQFEAFGFRTASDVRLSRREGHARRLVREADRHALDVAD